MLNDVRRRVTTYPGTGQVVTTPGASCNVHGWPSGSVLIGMLYHMHYNNAGLSWNIQRIIQHFQNINLTHKIRRIRSHLGQVLLSKLIYSWPSWKMAAILNFRLANLTELI